MVEHSVMQEPAAYAAGRYGRGLRRERRNKLSQVIAAMDLVVLAVFILYAVHVVVSPQDSQVIVEQGAMESTAYGQLINGSYGQVFFLLYAGVRSLSFPRAYFALLKPLGILSVFALLSTAWSIEPLTTLHRAFDLFLCVMMPAFLAQALGFSQCCRAVWITLSGIILLSVLMALAGIDYALMKGAHTGLWRGLFDHKNAFGPVAACLAILSFLMPVSVVRPRWLTLGMSGVALVAVAFAGSATTYIGLAIAAIAIALRKLCERLALSAATTFVTMVSVIGAGAAIAYVVAVAVLKFLGRSATLTGRTPLWEAAMPFTLKAPLGYGYGLGGGEDILNAVRIQSGWLVAPSLHSGYVTLAMDLGWVASVLFALFLLSKILILDKRSPQADNFMLMSAGLAALNLSLAFTESPFGAYLGAPLLLIMLADQSPRALSRRAARDASPATPAAAYRRILEGIEPEPESERQHQHATGEGGGQVQP